MQPTLEETVTQEEHRAFLEMAQAVAHIGSWVADLDGSGRLSWSAETYRIFGVAVGDFSGTTDAFYEFVHVEDREVVRAAVRAAIEGRQQYDIEHRIVTAKGELRWVHEKADVIRDDSGKAIRMIGTSQDVTERRELELQLRHSQKMEAIGRLAGGIAHDLNNALTTIAGFTELVLAELAHEHPARADVEEIRRAAARAESVTRKLLAFSRRQQLFTSRQFDLNDLVTALARLLERTLGDQISLRTQLALALPSVVGDSSQVEQAIVNLAVNARDAMARGGHLVLSTSVDEIGEAFARAHSPMPPGRYVVLAVADNGHGLDRETQARIFEPFFTTKEAGKGTGLGLAMVYGTMKQCSGFVFVESEVGRGATFRLYFPVVRPPAVVGSDRQGGAIEPSAADASATKRSTVLIVDDEPSIVNLIAAALRSDGYQLLKATSGSEALDLVAAHGRPLDLVVTDSVMPGLTGPELIATLRARTPDLPVILMSGNMQPFSEAEAGSAAISLMQKPFTPKELRAKVRDALK